MYDTVFVHDTTYVDVHDTTYVDVHDTTYVDVPYEVHDTVVVVDTLTLTHFDTITLYDTIILYDTVHDTIYITEQAIDDVETLNAKVYAHHGQVVVEGAEGYGVALFDAAGRRLTESYPSDGRTGAVEPMAGRVAFEVPTSGVYLVKIGNYPARKVVVVK